MTRLEVIALFSALKKLCDKNDLESVTDVVNEVLNAAVKNDNTQI